MARSEKVTVELSTQDRNLLKDIRDALLALNPDNDEARKANAETARRLIEGEWWTATD